MKKKVTAKERKLSAGSRIVASLKEAVDWVEGKDVAVRVTKVNVPMIDVRATRRRPLCRPGGQTRNAGAES